MDDSVRKVMFGSITVYAVSVISLFSDTLQAWSLGIPFHRNTFFCQERKYLSRMTQCELQTSLVMRVFAVAVGNAVDVLKPSSYDVSGFEAMGGGAHWHLDESSLVGAEENAPPPPRFNTKDVPRYWTCKLHFPIL